MEAAGLQPDVLAYNSAISAYAGAGAWEKAWALFVSERIFLLAFHGYHCRVQVLPSAVVTWWCQHHAQQAAEVAKPAL
jgi:pentatricopeptide repeat protein